MSRSSKKGVYIEEKLLEKARAAKDKGDRRPIKTWSRRSTITPELVGLTFAIHNGKSFTSIFVTENMVGHRLGEFSPTRTFRKHSGAKGETAEAGATAATEEKPKAAEKAKPAGKA